MGPGDNGADQEHGFNSEDAENLIDDALSSDDDPPESNLPSDDVDDSLVLDSDDVTEEPPEPPDEGSHTNALDNLDNWNDEETLDGDQPEPNLPSHEVDEYLRRVSVLGS